MLENISEANKEKENMVQEKIYLRIKEKDSVIFNAGAGAGKTYALVECLKYVIREYGKILRDNNQRIICITYTKVAAEEIKSRIGNTSIVLISTIHERIWKLISSYQGELVEIHKEYLLAQIDELQEKLFSDEKLSAYRNLEPEKKDDFLKRILDKKEVYYQNYNKGAKEFRTALQNAIGNWDELLKNISTFKKIVDTLYKIQNYELCINNIEEKTEGYKAIKYNTMYNKDQLHKMRISHDTLLLYGYKIICKYNLLKQSIVDTFPYIFVDEYQDTNETVIKILAMLQQYSIAIGHKIFVGYFGDSVQNIYDDGVGKRINHLHTDLVNVDKVFNRRSTNEVIDVANRIRHDNIEQVSIYEDCDGGSVKFYVGKEEDINSFISRSSIFMGATEDEPVRCFMLTNKSVAYYSGFENIYDCFARTQYYKRYYNQLNTELLSDDVTKLGEIPILLYRVTKFVSDIQREETPLTYLLKVEVYKNKNLNQVKELIDKLRSINGKCLGEYIKALFDLSSNETNGDIKRVVEELFDIGESTYDGLFEYVCRTLFPEMETEEDSYSAKETIKELFDINIEEYLRWFSYIMRDVKSDVIYYTCHGTKGLEFQNVIIILGNAFGRKQHYFDFFFENYGKDSLLTGDKLLQYEKARNLLYVATSRTIKNLRILYIDEISKYVESVNGIFGKILKYEPEGDFK